MPGKTISYALPAGMFAALLAFAVGASGAAPDSQPIGFRVIERFDASRATRQFPNGRPIQVCLWYPAAAASASPQIAYRDYFLLSLREKAPNSTPDPEAERQATEHYRALLLSAGATPQEADALLARPMLARRDADPAAGRFPLILIAAGNEESAHDQAFLAEHLASSGYAVATVPSPTRIDGSMRKAEEIPAVAQAQADDLAVALRTARFEPQVRGGRYGVVAYSLGARSALLLEMEDPDLAALVSLDGGIGARAGKGELEKAKAFHRARATAPILHLYESVDPNMVPDFDLIRSLDRAQRWLIQVDHMRHAHFSSLGILVGMSPALARATFADEQTPAAWTAMAAAATSFLDHFVASSAVKKSAPWTVPASPFLHATPSPAPPAAKKALEPSG